MKIEAKIEPLFREHGKQVAALCWRPIGAQTSVLEVLLITSRNTRRWIIPKGWAEAECDPAETAAKEALEEAGVVGKIEPQPIGHYHYLKEKKDGGAIACSVAVFALAVTGHLNDWPEKEERRIVWLPLAQAAVQVSEPGLRPLMKDFHPRHLAQKSSAAHRRR